jgi:hypothetical protein
VYSDEDKVTVVSGRLPKFSLPWPVHVATFGITLIGIVFFHTFPFEEPWPLSLVIALVALALLAWIPMINWVIQNRQGVAWSVRNLSNIDHGTTQTVRLAIWNYGFRTLRVRPGSDSALLVLRIEGLDPETEILEVTLVQTAAEPIPFQIQMSADGRRAELSTDEIAVRKGAVFNVMHTGARSMDIDVSANLENATLAFFLPSAIVTLPTWGESVKRPSVVLGVLILLALTLFWLHVGHFPLTLVFHSMIAGLVSGTFSAFVLLILHGATGSHGSRYFPRYVGLPVGLERFFENGG